MAVKRRDFLGGVAAVGLAGLAWPAAGGTVSHTLRPEALTANINGVGQTLLGFNGSWPGPELRARQGDDLSFALITS